MDLGPDHLHHNPQCVCDRHQLRTEDGAHAVLRCQVAVGNMTDRLIKEHGRPHVISDDAGHFSAQALKAVLTRGVMVFIPSKNRQDERHRMRRPPLEGLSETERIMHSSRLPDLQDTPQYVRTALRHSQTGARLPADRAAGSQESEDGGASDGLRQVPHAVVPHQ